MKQTITRTFLENRLHRVIVPAMGWEKRIVHFDYNKTYGGYRLIEMTGNQERQLSGNERLSAREMLSFLDGILFCRRETFSADQKV